jgi:hypothetical protein
MLASADPAYRDMIALMTSKSQPKPNDPEQSKRFLEAARETEADETETGADRAFKHVAKPPKRR